MLLTVMVVQGNLKACDLARAKGHKDVAAWLDIQLSKLQHCKLRQYG